MEKSWTIGGAYADWTLTLRIDPPQYTDELTLTEWPHGHADRIAQYFHEVVNGYENAQEIEEYHRRCA